MLCTVFIKGLVLGVSIAAPVGPIGLLCIRRTMERGRLAGLITGLGAAAADTIFALAAAFGLSVGTAVTNCSGWLHVAAGVFLIALGLKMAAERPASGAAAAKGGSPLWWFLSTFMLTISSPVTILSFVAAFALLGPAGGGLASNLQMTLGVFAGSVAWWLALSAGVGALKLSPQSTGTIWIGRICGAAIAAFGVWSLLAR